MNDGLIQGNHAFNGGGVNAMDLYSWGAEDTWKEIDGDGMQSGLGTEGWNEISPGAFTMNGGKIVGNSAMRTGGGVNVVSNGVTLRDGAIFDNTASYYGDDIAHDNYGGENAYTSYFSQRMLGFGDLAYYKDGGRNDQTRYDPTAPGIEQVFNGIGEGPRSDVDYHASLVSSGVKSGPQISAGRTAPTEDQLADWMAAKEAASDWSTLVITRNTSYRGAGIGSNGRVNIGYDHIAVDFTKLWDSTTLNDEFAWEDENGDSITLSDPPGSVVVQLTATIINNAGDDETINVGSPVIVTKNDEGKWTHTFTDLPEKINGQVVAYDVIEVDLPGFVASSVMSKRTLLTA